jgi:ribosomal protein S1
MSDQTLATLLDDEAYLQIPKIGDVIRGSVISASRREVRLDVNGIKTGVIRGRELYAESSEYASLKTGDEVEATVVELENENGEVELSFRFAGQKKAWEEIARLFKSGDVIPVKVLDANKGGLIVRVENVTLKRPSLNDVFLQLTGRELRE